MFPLGIVPGKVGLVFLFQFRKSTEPYLIPELLTVGSVRAFDLSILRRLPWINEVMDDVSLLARAIKHMKTRV